MVDGVNVAARHRKPSQTNPQGGIDRSPAPMHDLARSRSPIPRTASRPASASRAQDGKKVRVAVKSGEMIDG